MAKKKMFVVYRTPEFRMQSQVFLFQLPHSKGQSVRPEVPLDTAWVRGGCAHTVKWLETQQWILWFSPLKVIIWLVLGFLKTSRETDCTVLTTLGPLFLERFCTEPERFEICFPKLPVAAVRSATAHQELLRNTGDLCASVVSNPAPGC